VKLVSLSPSITEILTTLGALDRLVGATDACELTGNHVTRLGPPKALQISKFACLKPDRILADARENRPEEIEKLEKHWPVKIFDVRRLQDVGDCVADLGRLVGKSEEAKQWNAALRKEIASNEEAFRDRPRKRAVLLIWNQPYLTVNFDTYPSRLVEASGGTNVFRKEPILEFPVEMEEMIEENPEVLLLAGGPAPFQKRDIAKFRQYRIFSKIPIHLVKLPLLDRYGPQTIEALKTLRQIFESIP